VCVCGTEQRQGGIWEEGIEGAGLGGSGRTLYRAWEWGHGSFLPPYPNPLLQPFLPPCNRFAQRQNDVLSRFEWEALSASLTANKPGPPSGEGDGSHEGPARVTSCGCPSCVCPLPLLCSEEGDWALSTRAVVLCGHPWGCSWRR